MSAQLVVRLIGVRIPDKSDFVIFSETFNSYDPSRIEEAIHRMIEQYRTDQNRLIIENICLGESPQISVLASMLGDSRPVLNLSKETILKLCEINASFDFDPYF